MKAFPGGRLPELLMLALAIAVAAFLISVDSSTPVEPTPGPTATTAASTTGGAPAYVREEFGDGWASTDGCDTRNRILARDLTDVVLEGGSDCVVVSGTLTDPYTGQSVDFQRGRATSSKVQVDHVLPLAEAWRSGAHAWTYEQRVAFANDPANLLAVDGSVNASKSDDSLAEFVDDVAPEHRCRYARTYVAVARHYGLPLPPQDAAAAAEALEACA